MRCSKTCGVNMQQIHRERVERQLQCHAMQRPTRCDWDVRRGDDLAGLPLTATTPTAGSADPMVDYRTAHDGLRRTSCSCFLAASSCSCCFFLAACGNRSKFLLCACLLALVLA